VSKDDLGRIPIPDPQTMPIAQLASLADSILHERDNLENDFVAKYGAKLPEFDDGNVNVYIAPSAVLATSRMPKLTMLALVGRGEVKNYGATNGRIKALRARNLIACPLDAAHPHVVAFTQVLALFLNEPERENDTWSQAQNWLLPEMVAARAWLTTYNTLTQQAQANWERYVLLQRQIDEVVAN